LNEPVTLLFQLKDTDKITNWSAMRLILTPIPDDPPQLQARLRGIGPAITPQARLPVVGKITDDYGVAEVWFEYALDQAAAAKEAIFDGKARPERITDYTLERAFDVKSKRLKPGQRLALRVKTADYCTLGPKPNETAGELWHLEVVTAEDLRVRLEARELLLRQRYEAVLQEVEESRELLRRVDVSPPSAPAKKNARTPATRGPFPAAFFLAAEPAPKPEGGDKPSERGVGAERPAWDRVLTVQRARQNSRQNAQEVQGIAEQFDEIRQELENNEIKNPELMRRVKEGIADPLRHIAEEMFPELDDRLGRLGAEKAEPELHQQALEQINAILVAMREVRGRMLEMETYNEAVELLRTIIQDQQKLNEETKKRHKQDLLKE
jgi:hypothetical protein